MARQIPLNQIGNHMDGQIRKLVKATTLEWEGRVIQETPVDTGRLRGAWQNKIEPYVGEVTNNVEYAEPVCYGTNLPASWGGSFRTRQGTTPGFPELIGKELEAWAQQQYQKIVRSG